jgi:hypothetical protein
VVDDLEAIRQLKARYFRLIDTKQWDALADVFTDDFEGEFEGPHPTVRVSGRDQMIESVRRSLAEAVTVHHGHMPEIELLDGRTARGIWAMVDIVKLGAGFTGYGHYHDEYRKEGDHWRVARSRLTRLYVEPHVPAGGAD